jgi:putative transposase
MKKGFELRIYPNKHQQKLIKTTFGCTRFVHNKILAIKKELWNEYRLSFNPKLKSFKEEWKFLTKVPSQSLANAYMDSMKSFDNFFKCVKGKSKAQQKFPRFKKKGKSKDSFRIAATKTSSGYDLKVVDRNHIKIPKLGIIQFANYNDLDWTKIHIYNITIKQSAVGNYYASLCCELPETEYKEPKYNATAFDLGLTDFAIFDSGDVIENPRYFRKSQNKLAKEQRLLSRMIRGSKNYNEKKLKIAKIHEHIKNQRKDFQHKVSLMIVNENQVIISEDLNVKGMLKNHKLAKSIQDASFSSFCNMIKYKAEQKKRIYLKIDRFFPSSKICHHCGFKYKGLKLSERFWICPECGTYLNRDENAAINILNEGLKILNKKYPDGTGESDTNVSKPIDTCFNRNIEWENQLTVGKSTVFSS